VNLRFSQAPTRILSAGMQAMKDRNGMAGIPLIAEVSTAPVVDNVMDFPEAY